MSTYRIFRMKPQDRQRFRWAPHTAGLCSAKPKDYEEQGAVEASTVYAAWAQLKAAGHPLDLGDILIDPNEQMRIVKYVGFEEVRWLIPEAKTGLEEAPPEYGAPEPPAKDGPVL